ncbi:MAG TPA: hypothetical protein VN461_16605 [Vicinamibacteria bacterium]|nr:hypothetical protein [Vicinamibacteria bacterium]
MKPRSLAFLTVSLTTALIVLGLALARVLVGAIKYGHTPLRSVLVAALAGALALYALFVVVWTLGVPKRRRFLPFAAVAWWLGVECAVPPFLSYPFLPEQYEIIRDVDHWPRDTGSRQFNADALRDTPDSEAFHAEGLNLIILGDSFTYGYGVKATESFPSCLRRLLRDAYPGRDVEVANFGWISSSPLLSYRRLEKIGDQYKPKIVVLCVDMTDFSEDIRYQLMLDRRGLYALYDRIPIALATFERLAPETYQRFLSWTVGGIPVKRYFVTEAPLSETRPFFAPLVFNLDRINAWCRRRGADFVFVLLPRSHQYSAREAPHNWESHEYTRLGPYALEPFRYFDELRGHVPYPVVSLLPDFQAAKEFPLYLDNDPHWSAAGNRVAAEAIWRAIRPLVDKRLPPAPAGARLDGPGPL